MPNHHVQMFKFMKIEPKKCLILILLEDIIITIAITALILVNRDIHEIYFHKEMKILAQGLLILPPINIILITVALIAVFRSISIKFIKKYVIWRKIICGVFLLLVVIFFVYLQTNAFLTKIKLQNLQISELFILNFEKELYTNHVIFAVYLAIGIFYLYLQCILKKAINYFSNGTNNSIKNFPKKSNPPSSSNVNEINKKDDKIYLIEESETKRKLKKNENEQEIGN